MLIKYELKKLCKNRLVPVILILLTLLNVYLLLSSSSLSKESVGYKRALDEFIKVYENDPDGVCAYIDAYQKEYEAYLASFNPSSGSFSAECPESIYTDNDYVFFKKYFIPLRDISTSYKKDIGNAARIARGHIEEYDFLGYPENSFEIKYQTGVLDSYKALSSLDFPLSDVRGFDVFLDYTGFGVTAMAAMLIGGMLIVLPDRNSGAENVIRVCKRGRGATFWAKLTAAFLYSTAVCALFSAAAFAVIGIACGYSGAQCPVQMISSYRFCPLLITVGQTVLLSVLMRFFSCFVFILIAVTISCFFSDYLPAFMLGVAFAGANYFASDYRYLNSYAPLKNLNFLWSINAKEMFTVYRGVKLGELCLPMPECCLAVYTAVALLCVLISYLLFTRGKGLRLCCAENGALGFLRKIKGSVSASAFKRKEKRRIKHKSLALYELKKIFTPFSSALLCALILCTVIMSENSFNKSKGFYGRLYDEYMTELSGEWTEEKALYLSGLYLEYTSVISEKENMTDMYRKDEIAEDEYRDFIIKCDYAEARIENVKELLLVSNTLEKLNRQGKKAEFVNETGWKQLKTTGFSYLYILVQIMIFADIFSCEYRDGFISIQRSTVFGRRRVLKIKLMLSVIITVLIFTVCEGIQYFYVARYTGLPSPLAPAAGAPCLSCTEDISIIGCFLLTFLRQLTAGIIITLLTAFVSRFTKKPLPTAALMICVAFAPAALSYFGFDFLNAVSPVLLTGRA